MNYKKVLIIFIPLFCILVLIPAVFIFWKVYRIKKVVLISKDFPIKGLYKLNNSSSFFINEKKILSDIISQNSDIYTINIKKIFPDTLIITPIFRTPAAKVYNKSDEYNLVDKEGYFLTISENSSGLSNIYAYGIGLTMYSKPDWRIIKSLNYIKRSAEKGIPIENLTIDQENDVFILHLKAGEEVLVPQMSAPAFVTDSLQLIVSRFRIEGKIVSKIDFTSDKPVVTLRSEDKNYSN
jgi:hypothetical protein